MSPDKCLQLYVYQLLCVDCFICPAVFILEMLLKMLYNKNTTRRTSTLQQRECDCRLIVKTALSKFKAGWITSLGRAKVQLLKMERTVQKYKEFNMADCL